MAAPIISGNHTVLAYGLGQDFVFQLVASEQPSAWELGPSDTLPTGVFFDTLRGTFSGSGTTAGIWNITVSARNSDGWSAPVLVTLGIFEVAASEVYRDLKIDLDNFAVLANPFDLESEVKGEVIDDVDIALAPADISARLNDDLVFRISFARLARAKTTTTTPPTGTTTVPSTSTSEVKVETVNNFTTVVVGGKEVVYELVNAPLVMARFALRGNVSEPPFLQTDRLAFKRTTELIGGEFQTVYFIYASLAGLPALESWLSEKESDLTSSNNVTCEFELEFKTPRRAPGPDTQIITTKPFTMRVLRDTIQ